MTYYAGICQGVTVHVTGKTPADLDNAALDQAILFFGKPSINHHFVCDHYVATEMEVIRGESGFVIQATWEADVTVRLVEKRSGY